MGNPNTAPQPAPHEAMTQSVDAARQAILKLNGRPAMDYSWKGQEVETMRAPGDHREVKKIPELFVRTRHADGNVAFVGSAAAGQDEKSHYHAAIETTPGSSPTHRAIVRRYGKHGEQVYEHRYKDPKTAEKFIAKIGEHVTKRAQKD